MSIFNFFKNSKDDYELLVEFYEEYIKSCTLQPVIFGQMAYPNGEMDVFNNDVENKISYVSQYSRLMDVIRLGVIRDKKGNEINITLGQEYFLRFTLATWIISQLNSYDTLGMKIREAMYNGYTQLVYIVNIKILSSGRWFANGEVHLYKSNSDIVKYMFSNTLLIDEEKFFSDNPIQTYNTFNDTPKLLLMSMYQVTYMLMLYVPPIVDFKNGTSRGRIYADFWLKKMIASIIVSSDEWENLIQTDDNIERIENIRYYLWDENPLSKQIQFKFDIKLIKQDKWISLDYEYTINSAAAFGLINIDKLCDFILWNHNLQD